MAFDWFAVIKPLEGPMKGLWNRGWLRSGHSGPSADFILCIARGLPAFLLSLVDTGIFYSVRCNNSGGKPYVYQPLMHDWQREIRPPPSLPYLVDTGMLYSVHGPVACCHVLCRWRLPSWRAEKLVRLTGESAFLVAGGVCNIWRAEGARVAQPGRGEQLPGAAAELPQGAAAVVDALHLRRRRLQHSQVLSLALRRQV